MKTGDVVMWFFFALIMLGYCMILFYADEGTQIVVYGLGSILGGIIMLFSWLFFYRKLNNKCGEGCTDTSNENCIKMLEESEEKKRKEKCLRKKERIERSFIVSIALLMPVIVVFANGVYGVYGMY